MLVSRRARMTAEKLAVPVVVENTPDKIETDPVVQAIYLGGGH